MIWIFLVLVLLSAHAKRFTVSRMQDFKIEILVLGHILKEEGIFQWTLGQSNTLNKG